MSSKKLVRDLVISAMRRKGLDPQSHMADEAEYAELADMKILEEAEEVAVAAGGMRMADDSDRGEARAKLIEELGDLREIAFALMRLYGIDDRDVEEARLRKLEAKGGFETRTVLDVA